MSADPLAATGWAGDGAPPGFMLAAGTAPTAARFAPLRAVVGIGTDSAGATVDSGAVDIRTATRGAPSSGEPQFSQVRSQPRPRAPQTRHRPGGARAIRTGAIGPSSRP